jgi:hypothetical protein
MTFLHSLGQKRTMDPFIRASWRHQQIIRENRRNSQLRLFVTFFCRTSPYKSIVYLSSGR